FPKDSASCFTLTRFGHPSSEAMNGITGKGKQISKSQALFALARKVKKALFSMRMISKKRLHLEIFVRNERQPEKGFVALFSGHKARASVAYFKDHFYLLPVLDA